MVRLLRSGKCDGSYDVLWKCSVFFDIYIYIWYILMILTRHLAHLGSSWLSICLYTATNTEQLTSWQPDHPIIVRLRLILISWLISLVQLSSAWFSFVDCVIICNKLLFLVADVAAAVRKEAFAAQEATHQLLRERKQLWLSDEELEIYRLSTRLVSTHLDVQVCWAVGMFNFTLFDDVFDCICFVFFATSKRPRLLVLSCIDSLLNCLVFQSKNIIKWSGILVSASGRSAPVVGSCLTSQVWIGRGRFACCHRPISRHFSWEGYLFLDFFRGRFWIFFGVPGSMLSCFSAFLLFCFSAFLLLCFSAFLLFAFPASLLVYFFSFLLPCCFPCFSAFVLLCLSTSTILLFLFFSHVFLLSYFLLLCFSASCLYMSLLPLCFFLFLRFILSCLYPKWNPRETLGQTQRIPKEILIRNPNEWNPKQTLQKP